MYANGLAESLQQSAINQDTVQQLHKAQRTLEEMEFKMKSYKKNKNQTIIQSKKINSKVPYPDLTKYISYLMEDAEHDFPNKKINTQVQTQHHNDQQYLDNSPKMSSKSSLIGFKSKPEQKQNNSNALNLNHDAKSRLLIYIQQHYKKLNDDLEARISELSMKKEKNKRDQELLSRNNQQLQKQIHLIRSLNISDGNRQEDDIAEKVNSKNREIMAIEESNQKIRKRKINLQNQIKQILQNQKAQISSDLPKAKMHRCQYH